MSETLQTRLTRKYVGTCDYLDDWADIGTFEVLSRGTVEWDDTRDEDCTDPMTQIYSVAVDSDEPHDVIQRALCDYFTKTGCHHDYDCCGCRSYVAYKWNVFHRYANRWTVIVNSSRNY